MLGPAGLQALQASPTDISCNDLAQPSNVNSESSLSRSESMPTWLTSVSHIDWYTSDVLFEPCMSGWSHGISCYQLAAPSPHHTHTGSIEMLMACQHN